VEPLKLKGKAEPVPAYRLLEILPEAPAFTRVLDIPFVGREEELAVLERAFAAASEQRVPQLTTIVGPPGIGKSRLVRELVRRSGARVLVGRCLSYGDGITYWPVAEVVSQVGDVNAVLAAERDGALAASRIAAAVGPAEAAASSEEIAWGVRKLLEVLARERPLIVVMDDIHWAEPTLLDLIEYVATFARDARLVVLCIARPDLFELRPAWAAPKPNAAVVKPATSGPMVKPTSPQKRNTPTPVPERSSGTTSASIAAGGTPANPKANPLSAIRKPSTSAVSAQPNEAQRRASAANEGTSTGLRPRRSASAPAG
jgi:hypothetical protein